MADYDLFAGPCGSTRPWTGSRPCSTLDLEIKVLEEQIARLAQELRTTTQRVNLFEKVKIPETAENIKRIRIYLGDQQTAQVVRGKIAKRKGREGGVMIAPMKKAILVVRERGKSAALRFLRRLGVVHADPIRGRGQSWESASEERSRIDAAVGILLSYKPRETASPLDYKGSLALAKEILETAETDQGLPGKDSRSPQGDGAHPGLGGLRPRYPGVSPGQGYGCPTVRRPPRRRP